MARTAALPIFQNPAHDRESNSHAILISIWFFSPLKLLKGCGFDSRIYGKSYIASLVACCRIRYGNKHRKTRIELQLVLIYTHFFCTSMIRLEYTNVASNNFISNCLRHITLFTIFLFFIIFIHFRLLYILHHVCILACEGSDIKPEMQLCKMSPFYSYNWISWRLIIFNRNTQPLFFLNITPCWLIEIFICI